MNARARARMCVCVCVCVCVVCVCVCVCVCMCECVCMNCYTLIFTKAEIVRHFSPCESNVQECAVTDSNFLLQ